MADKQLTSTDMQEVLKDIGDRFHALKLDELFVVWFLRSYITESEQLAAEAVSGGAHDKGIDALFIDDGARAVIVVQGKYHKSFGEKSEKRADVVSLAEIAHQLSDADDKKFEQFANRMPVLLGSRLKDSRKRVLDHDYRVLLYFVTLGKVTELIKADSDSFTKKARCDARLEVIDAARAQVLLRDYLDGVAPPIPALDLEMEDGSHVRVNGVSQRYDEKNKIESWVFTMRGDKVAAHFLYAGPRLFARNIRGYLGRNTPINRGMVKTLKDEPNRFFYYNNGVTILCDEAVRKGQQGHDVLHVRNPQVINGQQTTRTLAEHADLAANASVLVKVIRVEQRLSNDSQFDRLLSSIVTGTNWQNQIKASDLIANDRIQIELERSLRKLQYGYIRKRQTKGEARRQTGSKHYRIITKAEFAQAVAACELDPVVARTGSEKLFEEQNYGKVFPNADPLFYLPRYWAMKEVVDYLKGTGDRRETRWLVLNTVWARLSAQLKSSANSRAFAEQCQRQDGDLVVPLSRAISAVVDAAKKFYAINRGKGADAVDMPTFFKSKRAGAKPFAAFWQKSAKERAAFEKQIAKAIDAIGK